MPTLKKSGPNVKIVAAISWELYKRQDKKYRELIIAPDQWNDTMVITNGALRLMNNWISNPIVKKYSMSPDFDNRWRTGGSVGQIIEESQLDPESILNGIKKFAKERLQRLNKN